MIAEELSSTEFNRKWLVTQREEIDYELQKLASSTVSGTPS
jgi:hypothetical protein